MKMYKTVRLDEIIKETLIMLIDFIIDKDVANYLLGRQNEAGAKM